jgi:hypothetical protein
VKKKASQVPGGKKAEIGELPVKSSPSDVQGEMKGGQTKIGYFILSSHPASLIARFFAGVSESLPPDAADGFYAHSEDTL